MVRIFFGGLYNSREKSRGARPNGTGGGSLQYIKTFRLYIMYKKYLLVYIMYIMRHSQNYYISNCMNYTDLRQVAHVLLEVYFIHSVNITPVAVPVCVSIPYHRGRLSPNCRASVPPCQRLHVRVGSAS